MVVSRLRGDPARKRRANLQDLSVSVGGENRAAVDDGAGAGGRNRTRDPLITNQVLYRLSYTGTRNGDTIMCAPNPGKISAIPRKRG